ncbi:putative bifunctional diguanylate cyclase/phosphodiesterase [Marinobacterium aestuariivivens]|uniref:Bifunctional diguanylate cyclase/phosphodiesterase n=1 Tax=Marinobacterium aestuariivivens TaxID=1698799 RepID=A0ABW2A409_9GAMM
MPITKRKKYWLTLVSIGLVLSFSVTLYIQFYQSRLLASAVEYNENDVSWGVFQLEREALQFQLSLKNALDDLSNEALDQLQLRYEILWSRFDVVALNPTSARLLDSEEYRSALAQLDGFFDATEHYVIDASPAALDRQTIQQISRTLEPVLPALQALSNLSIHRAIELAEFRTSEVRDQIKISTALIFFQLVLTLVFFYMVIRLVRKLQASHAELDKLANFDLLTGLPNRRLFYDRLEQEIRKAERDRKRIALMYIDLDNFKDVNDTQGHEVGDALLKEASSRLSKSIRKSDTVARLGGDEFTVILPGLDDFENVAQVSETILARLTEPFCNGEHRNFISASIGITIYPDDAADVNTLLQHADQAMYVAKHLGRNRYHYFTPDMQDLALARMQRIHDLRNALTNREFCLCYQPIVDLASGRVRKAEALIRWNHPAEGLVAPGDFIPLAEETGLIIEMGSWIFEEAAEQVSSWRQNLDPDFQISINTSPVQLRSNGSKLEDWLAWLEQLDLPGDAIAMEITESILMDAAASERLLAVQKMGLEVSLDDFGTGYSTLSYLKKFDIDYLKIDRSFVQNLAPASSDAALCEAIILMAHKLGIRVIAEGIETEAQRACLAAMGCDYGQGYLFSKAVNAAEFEQRIRRNRILSQPCL